MIGTTVTRNTLRAPLTTITLQARAPFCGKAIPDLSLNLCHDDLRAVMNLHLPIIHYFKNRWQNNARLKPADSAEKLPTPAVKQLDTFVQSNNVRCHSMTTCLHRQLVFTMVPETALMPSNNNAPSPRFRHVSVVTKHTKVLLFICFICIQFGNTQRRTRITQMFTSNIPVGLYDLDCQVVCECPKKVRILYNSKFRTKNM